MAAGEPLGLLLALTQASDGGIVTKTQTATARVTKNFTASRTATARITLPISQLVDSFDGVALDSAKWVANANVSVSGGLLNFNATTSVASYPVYQIRNSQIYIVNETLTGVFGLTIGSDLANLAQYQFTYDQAQGRMFVYYSDFSDAFMAANILLAASQAKWLRIRDVSGTIFFEYSPDGVSWSVVYTDPNAIGVQGDVYAQLIGQNGSKITAVNSIPVITPTKTQPATGRITKALTKAQTATANIETPPGVLAGYSYRQKITVDGTKVIGSHTNFPVHVNLANLATGFFTNIRSDGGDIRVTTGDGTTQVPFELVAVDKVGGTGELWFKAPSLANLTNTKFYIYYGAPSSTLLAANSTYGSQNVWDANYKNVYHMNDASGGFVDSTAAARTVSNNVVGTGPAYGSTTKIGKGATFAGGQVIATPANDTANDFTGAFTISTWMSSSQNAAFPGLFGHINAGITNGWTLQTNATKATFWINSTTLESPASVCDGAQHYIVAKRDGSGNAKLFVDGVLVNSGTLSGDATATGGAPLYFGSWGTAGYNYSGTLDEIRTSTGDRSDNWIATEYNNQNSPATFYAPSAQEALSFTVTKTQLAAGRISKAFTLSQIAATRITKAITKTQPAVARVQSSRTFTQTSTARIQLSRLFTQGATSRITRTLIYPQVAIARLQKSFTKTQPAAARVTKDFTLNQTSTARISKAQTRTQTTTSRITKSLTLTQLAAGRIAKSFTKTQSATAKINPATMSITQLAAARISIIGTRTQLSTGRVTKSMTLSQTAAGRIAKSFTRTQPAIARVARSFTRTQTATANITIQSVFTQLAVGRILKGRATSRLATARITKNLTSSQPAIARISKAYTLTQTATARITKSITYAQLATVRINKVVTKTQTAVGRVTKNLTRSQTSTARVSKTFTKVQPATGRVSATGTFTQSATARIAKLLTFTQEATARITFVKPGKTDEIIIGNQPTDTILGQLDITGVAILVDDNTSIVIGNDDVKAIPTDDNRDIYL